MDKIHEQDCIECGTTFEPKRSDAQFCSARCRVRHHRHEPRPVTGGPGVVPSELTVTPPPLVVCRCPDCRDLAANPVGYWDRVIARALNESEVDESEESRDPDYWHTRCDYCGRLFRGKHHITWEFVDELDDGTCVQTTGVYCSNPCGQYAAARAGSSRG